MIAGRQVIDTICREIHRIDAMHYASQDRQSHAAFWTRLEWDGEIIGLRKALCALFGWPMKEAADNEGKAAEYAARWREAGQQ